MAFQSGTEFSFPQMFATGSATLNDTPIPSGPSSMPIRPDYRSVAILQNANPKPTPRRRVDVFPLTW
jgi:hypothetical protein